MADDANVDKRRLFQDELLRSFSLVSEGNYAFSCDLKTGYARLSKAAIEYFGIASDYLAGGIEDWAGHIHPDDLEAYQTSMARIISGEDTDYDIQYRVKNRDGRYVICTTRGTVFRDVDGNPDFFCGAVRNHGAEGHINILTGLRNQYGFMQDLDVYISEQREFTVTMFGFMHFSEINSVYGYDFGNQLITRFGRRVLEVVGTRGIVYRLDGTRFAVLSHSMKIEDMAGLYNSLRDEMYGGFRIEEEKVSLIMAGGAMHIDSFDVNGKTIFACLNYAFSESKHEKQGDFVAFHNALTADNSERLAKLSAIRDSVIYGCRGFVLYYQPVVNAKTFELIGAEALIRYSHEKYGTIYPDDFIPVLENDAMFPVLGEWILRRAVTDAKEYMKTVPDFIVSVNLSYAQLKKDDFVQTVQKVLSDTGFPPQNLCLEITERCRLLDIHLLKSITQELRALGIRFALDDFGTGFSSASLLQELTFDTIKIDRAFVMNIATDMREQALVEHFTGIAAIFGSDVCVEGIEDNDVRDTVIKYPVSSLQGYLYSKPISKIEFIEKFLNT